LDKIPVLERPFDIIHYNPYLTSNFTTVLTNDVISNFRLALRDQNGRLLQMNDVRFELSLLIEVHDNKQIQPEVVQPQVGRRNLVGEMRNEMAALVETAPSQQSGIAAGPIIPVQSLFTPTPKPVSTLVPSVPAPAKPVVPVPIVPKAIPVEPPITNEQINADAELTDALLMAIQLDLE